MRANQRRAQPQHNYLIFSCLLFFFLTGTVIYRIVGALFQGDTACRNDHSDSQVKSQADYLLFDAPIAGSGQTFDWQLLADKQIEQDYFIAGGLTVDNVAEAKETFHPYALDVSSGVETDGHKDLDKIKAFIERVKA